MQSTPSSERIHIAIFGRTNAGKSTLTNRLIGQDVAIVSPHAGTTTDPVQKPIEINGLGAAVVIDTPGLDDNTTLGKERMERTAKVLDRTDIAIVLFTDEGIDSELRILEECRIREISTIAALAQIDRIADYKAVQKRIGETIKGDVIAISSTTGEGIDELITRLAKIRPIM